MNCKDMLSNYIRFPTFYIYLNSHSTAYFRGCAAIQITRFSFQRQVYIDRVEQSSGYLQKHLYTIAVLALFIGANIL